MPKIELKDCKPGYLYRIHARNIRLGVFTENANGPRAGFIGIRTKWASRFLDTELHHDVDQHFGTATPTEELVACPIVDLRRDLGLVCKKCEAPMHHVGKPGEIRHVHTTPTDCVDDWGWLASNKELFAWLEEMEKEYPDGQQA